MKHSALPLLLALGLVLLGVSPALALVTEACPSTLSDGGFTDLGGLSGDSRDAIDCVAHFDITRGTSATAFSPHSNVARWQMALFLTRTVSGLGLPLPNGSDQGFNDIGFFDAATETAINQLRQLGVSFGVSSQTFNPFGAVPRWQMALFLTRLLTAVGIGLPSGASQGFTDIAAYDSATQQAINRIRQLGISTGTTATTFSPDQAVTRWQMALFVARALEVGGAAPYRVSITLPTTTAPTADSVVATVTVRNPDGSPAAGRRVDVFVVAALDNGGRCVLDNDARINAGDAATGTNCVIDNNDPQTNSQGVVTVTLGHTDTAEVDTIYAWVGENGETFDQQDVRGEGSIQLTWGATPTGLNLPTNLNHTFGTNASVKAQLTGSGGANVPLGNQSIRFVVRRGNNIVLSQTVTTTGDGSATLVYTGPNDPTNGDDQPIVDTVTAFWDRDRDNQDDGANEFDDSGTVTWDEAGPPVTTASLSQTEVSTLIGNFTAISITVRDGNNQPVVGALVSFQSTSGQSTVATTNGSGVAGFTYTVALDGLADSIDARVDRNGDGDVSDPGDLDFGNVSDLTHYWVEIGPDLAGSTQFDVIAINGGANTIDVVQVGTSNYFRLSYDSNDEFNVNGGGTESLDQFEGSLGSLSLPDVDGSGGTRLDTNPYSSINAVTSVFSLTT
jgi:S-layer homology domain